ncbi:hypothetical protein AERO9AM_10251 [Aeromicrobium sp. 9AM]|nr:hypothetical protein AERO9AM_10251 [Aeromicrobium sp. 9AM]
MLWRCRRTQSNRPSSRRGWPVGGCQQNLRRSTGLLTCLSTFGSSKLSIGVRGRRVCRMSWERSSSTPLSPKGSGPTRANSFWQRTWAGLRTAPVLITGQRKSSETSTRRSTAVTSVRKGPYWSEGVWLRSVQRGRKGRVANRRGSYALVRAPFTEISGRVNTVPVKRPCPETRVLVEETPHAIAATFRTRTVPS